MMQNMKHTWCSFGLFEYLVAFVFGAISGFSQDIFLHSSIADIEILINLQRYTVSVTVDLLIVCIVFYDISLLFKHYNNYCKLHPQLWAR